MIKQALAAFQKVVLSIEDPDNMTPVEYDGLGAVGDKLIEYGWPLDRVLDLYYGMHPDATKPELPTREVAELMIAMDEEYKFNYFEREEDEESVEGRSFQMPFGRRTLLNIDNLLPSSGKRDPLP